MPFANISFSLGTALRQSEKHDREQENKKKKERS